METENKKKTKAFSQHLDKDMGKSGTEKTLPKFEIKQNHFAIGGLIKEGHKLTKLT